MPALTKNQYRNSIFIDFEGEGRSRSGEVKEPHICGVFKPNPKGKSGKYEAIIFRPFWKAVKNGMTGTAEIDDFNNFFQNLYIDCAKREKKIVFWTQHEEMICQRFLNKVVLEGLKPFFHNLHPAARSYANRREIFGESAKGKKLENFYKAFFPNRQSQPSLTPGPAEICRRIDRICESKTKWAQFNEREKEYVKDLFSYNQGDCRSTWLIALKIGSTKAKE